MIPRNRIAFHGTYDSARADVDVFKRVREEVDLILRKACEEVAANNRLEKVTKEQLLTEMLITGWFSEKHGI